MAAVPVVDAHVHVWTPDFAPDAAHPLPSLAGDAATLVSEMDAAGISKTVVVQPINYKFDHACVSAALAAHPTRLYGVALVDTSVPPEAADKFVRCIVEKGYRGVRVNPNFVPLRSASVLAVLEACADVDVPACLFVKPEHLQDVEHLLESVPAAKIILDHFAFARDESAVERLLALARFERLYIKASAWFRISHEKQPHSDTQALLWRVVEAFGSRRVLAGTDFPYVSEQYSYGTTFEVIDAAGLSKEDADWVKGKSAAELYKL